MNSGDLKNRITIEKRTTTKVKGIQTDVWNPYYSCWCSINSLFGTELYKSLEVKLENILNFTVRYTKTLDNLNTKEFRIVWGKKIVNGIEKDRVFNIVATDYFNFSKEKITIKAKEVI